VIFGGEHKRNIRDKSDTHDVESINSDLRTYIAGLRRRSRCFFRSLEALNAELALFVNAYNKFGENKERRRIPTIHKKPLENQRLHKFREVPFGSMNFV
jgi:hypothetical protein